MLKHLEDPKSLSMADLIKNVVRGYNENNEGKTLLAEFLEEPDYFRVSIKKSDGKTLIFSQREGNHLIQIRSVLEEICYKLMRHGLRDLNK